MIKPELMEYIEELKAYITADGGIDVFELKKTFYHDNPEKAGEKLKLDHKWPRILYHQPAGRLYQIL